MNVNLPCADVPLPKGHMNEPLLGRAVALRDLGEAVYAEMQSEYRGLFACNGRH